MKVSLSNSNYFFSLIMESAMFGKISIEKKCPFCGSHLTFDQTKEMQARIGRTRFLLRSMEEGSKTARDLLWKIYITKHYLGGIDMPLDTPNWWVEEALKISCEIGEAKFQEINKETNTRVMKL